jgi:outer membrane protein TolC
MNLRKYNSIGYLLVCVFYISCKSLEPVPKIDVKPIPAAFTSSTDTGNIAEIKWREFFFDKNLISLIDTALQNNPDVLITLQEIEVAKNNARFRKGLLYPTVTAGGALSIEKVGSYTSQGAGDASTEITPGKIVPENLRIFNLVFKPAGRRIYGANYTTPKRPHLRDI